MLIFKMISQLATALVAFAVATGIVAGSRCIASSWLSHTGQSDPLASSKPQSGIYFVTPSIDNGAASECDISGSELVPFGWPYIIPSEFKRSARDGRWFFFETKTDNGRSFEFFGIIPDTATKVGGNSKVTITGKLIRLTNGEMSGDVDATYTAPACAFQ